MNGSQKQVWHFPLSHCDFIVACLIATTGVGYSEEGQAC